jgi:hypothetical protein
VIRSKFKLLRRVLKSWARSLSNLKRLVDNCNMTIAFLDKLEELRSLHSHEAKFRKVIKSHLGNLLFMQREYWKQRFTQRVMQFGDETTRFFHAMCRMDLPGPTTSVGTRTNYSVGPWDYSTWAARHLLAWSTRTSVEKYSDRKLCMTCTM